MHNEITLSSELIFSGKIVKLYKDEVELENGSIASREVVRHNGGVAILAIDEFDQVLFVSQFRYPYKKVLLELPAGKLEKNEDPAACGLRELEEETGYIAKSYEFLAQIYPTPGYCDEILHLYLARDLVKSKQDLDDDEFLTVTKIPIKEAINLCMNGEIKDAKTVVSILKYALKLLTE